MTSKHGALGLRYARAMAKPILLFAHGAGAPSSHPWMVKWAELLGRLGRVVPFDYPYMQAGKKAPDRLPVLVEAHRAALAAARGRTRRPVVLVGKSMGSRVGCHLALEEPVAAVVCLGYPLRGMGRRAGLRDEVLRQLDTPILFVQGSRDSLCPLDALGRVRKKMKTESDLFVVEGGNHSLEVGKRALQTASETQADVDRRVLGAIRAFLSRTLAAG
jgi:predicted alpha/beta-hydrolase family hydrolase